MALSYTMIVIAAACFSTQFIFQQKYQRIEGTSLLCALRFSTVSSLLQILFLLFTPGEQHFSLPGVGIAALGALSVVANGFFSVKVFECADMTLFSIFEMLGGMTPPFVFGLLFFDEHLTVFKLIGFVLITAAIFIETGRLSAIKGKQLFYYAGLFLSNGMFGVFSKWNVSLADPLAAKSFMMLCNGWAILFCCAAMGAIVFKTKASVIPKQPKNMLITVIPYALISMLGNLLMQLALQKLPASVQYPMSTGGTIVISVIVSALRGEKPDKRGVIAAVIAALSSVAIAF